MKITVFKEVIGVDEVAPPGRRLPNFTSTTHLENKRGLLRCHMLAVLVRDSQSGGCLGCELAQLAGVFQVPVRDLVSLNYNKVDSQPKEQY